MQELNSALKDATENDLILELFHRGITLDFMQGAYYAIGEMLGHKVDVVFGNDEEGQHGKASEGKK